MKKHIALGMAAFGGILLIGIYLAQTGEETNTPDTQEQAVLELPAGIPTYPDAAVKSLRESESETAYDFSFSLETDASIKEINDWYREALQQNGWSIKSDKNVAGYQIIQAEHSNLFTSLQAAASSEPGKNTISQQAKIRK